MKALEEDWLFRFVKTRYCPLFPYLYRYSHWALLIWDHRSGLWNFSIGRFDALPPQPSPPGVEKRFRLKEISFYLYLVGLKDFWFMESQWHELKLGYSAEVVGWTLSSPTVRTSANNCEANRILPKSRLPIIPPVRLHFIELYRVTTGHQLSYESQSWSLGNDSGRETASTGFSEISPLFIYITAWSRILQKLTVIHLVKKFSISYGTRMLITVFTKADQFRGPV
jgi:hypothetical protein